MVQPAGRSTYVPHIDGLRAIAVLAVIVYHLNPHWLPGGLSGVDIFFVISGFVVSASLADFRKSTPHAFFAYFYARRMLRILPALVTCLLVTHVFAMMFVPFSWLSDSNQRTGLYAFFGVSNFFLARIHNNYFEPRADFNPYTHTWSLGVEEQFYLIFPLLFAAWIAGGHWRRFSTAMFAFGLVASLGTAAWLARTNPELSFYMLYTRFWELAGGALLYQLLVFTGHAFSETHRPVTAFSQSGSLVSVLLVVAAFALTSPRSYPFPGALLPVLGTLGLLFFLHGREPHDIVMRVLRVPAVVFVGQISYSLYLWHWPVFVLFRWTTGFESIGQRIIAVALTFVLATASYYFVERPPRRMLRLRALPRWAVIFGGAALIGVSTAIAIQINAQTEQWTLTRVGRNAADWYSGRQEDIGKRNCSLRARGEAVGDSMVGIWSGADCAKSMSAMPRLFVIGDSHAQAYSTMLMMFAMDTGTEVYQYANGGGSFLSMQLNRDGDYKAFAAAAVADMLQRMRKGDILFLPSLRLNRLTYQDGQRDETDPWQSTFSPDAVAMRRRAVDEAVVALAPFAARGVRIVFEAPKPILRVPPFRCVDWFNKDNPVCSSGLTMQRSELERYREPVMDAFAEIAKRVNGVSVWDPFPLLCPDEICNAITRDGHPLFYDGDHLSGYANRMLAPHFERWIGRLIGDEALANQAP
jgi:peptidoglycan/LPS O-acetylase OafA/YrhL